MKNVCLVTLLISMALTSTNIALANTLAIEANIVSENGAKKSWLVIDQTNGKITSVKNDETTLPEKCQKLKFNGYAFPGLIDTHNHLNWNSIAKWKPDKVYDNRQAWKDLPAGTTYGDEVTAVYKKMSESTKTPAPLFTSAKYSEIRAIAGGTTMIESSYSKDDAKAPPLVLARNLTFVPFRAWNDTTEVAKLKPEVLAGYKADLKVNKSDPKYLNKLFLHIAEGKNDDPVGLGEFKWLRDNDLMNSHVVVIHGGALGKKEFEEMAKNGMGLSWSPRSNIALYNETTRIPDAIKAGVTVALSPDWTISGSNNTLEEMKFAYDYARDHWKSNNPITQKRLFKMVTSDAARVAGIDDRTGKLQKGFDGDLFLAEKLDQDPFKSLLKTTPKNIALVVVEGKPVYGDTQQMTALGVSTTNSEPIEIEGVTKQIILKDGMLNQEDLKTIKEQIEQVIAPATIAPIIEKH
jgi:5-methylthioadenosine/S-adenosylhomocysteine deaminase